MATPRIALALGLAAVALSAFAQDIERKGYIIELVSPPAATYTGGVSGLAATKPVPGTKLNVTANDVQAYMRYLDGKVSDVAATVPSAQIYYRYGVVFNGFAAKLTDAEVQKLAANKGVRTITADEAMQPTTNYTPRFLGINQPGGVWSQTDSSGRLIKGEDVIIAHVDTGVWPEDPSFSDKVDASGSPIPSHLAGTVVYNPLPPGTYTGTCTGWVDFPASKCNNKLLGARVFNAGFIAGNGRTFWSFEYPDSPRDGDGHGSHTLSTAGGNENSPATLTGGVVISPVSGMAPRARVAAYKVCFDGPNGPGATDGGCFNSDSVAAINQAVADGADVINFSISGSTISFANSVEVAFANASFAGVFVAASAGNTGPANTVAHISPWLTTVAASTHDRFTVATATLGPPSGATFSGPSYQQTGVPFTPLIRAIDATVGVYASMTQTEKTLAERCSLPSDGGTANTALDPAKAAGKIVICYRGGNVLINKAATVKAGGGVAMLLQNVPAIGGTPASANTVILQPYVVPTIHLDVSAYAPINSYVLAQGGGATASFGPAVQQLGVVAPVMASFSSRGPNIGDPDILKPDITAPGVDINAAFTGDITQAQHDAVLAGTLVNPPAGAGNLQGTSMSSPHVAGAAALLKQANPTWSPYAIKSALMTSAQQSVKLANGSPDPDRWGYGSGHLNPNGALATTLVYDTSPFDYIDYFNGAIPSYQLNLASLTRANLVGVGSLTRTLTNKGTTTETYNVTAALPGFTVSVSPASVTLAPGASATFTATLTRTTATIGTYVFGDLTWTSTTGKVVRSPLTARPQTIAAVSTVTDTRAVGTKIFTVGTGYNGTMVTTPTGLVPATRFSGTVVTGASQCFPFTVPSGAKMLRAQLFNVDTQGGANSDLDLRVLRGTTLVGSSGGGDSDELVILTNPTAATNYQVCVDGFAPLGGSANFVASVWVVPATVVPATLRAVGANTVYLGGTASVAVSWNVPAGARYIGLVDFRTVAGGPIVGTTTVMIDNQGTSAPASVAPVLREKLAM